MRIKRSSSPQRQSVHDEKVGQFDAAGNAAVAVESKHIELVRVSGHHAAAADASTETATLMQLRERLAKALSEEIS